MTSRLFNTREHRHNNRLHCTLMVPMALVAVLSAALGKPVLAQEQARWYQVEVSIFTNENVNFLAERWPLERIASGFPRNVRSLDTLMNYLNLDDWSVLNPALPRSTFTQGFAEETTAVMRGEGPEPFHNGNFRLPDFERDAFVALPVSAHNFTDTNRALNASANYRLLYHNAWRQPVNQAAQATPIAIQAGRRFADRHELEGSLTIRFNPSQDRVVLDSLLWLTQFSTVPSGTELSLPPLPAQLLAGLPAVDDEQHYYPRQIIPFRDSRDMRSNEFHYVDHPALGIVIQVFPYTPPSAPVLQFLDDQTPL